MVSETADGICEKVTLLKYYVGELIGRKYEFPTIIQSQRIHRQCICAEALSWISRKRGCDSWIGVKQVCGNVRKIGESRR